MKIKDLSKLIIGSKDTNYNTLNPETGEYYKNFGLVWSEDGQKWACPDEETKNKIVGAYQRAISNRDFEINKFWSRAAYYWGFIILAFGAYWQINETEGQFMELVVTCLGLIFSVAWFCVIQGSKHWQENWESHIDSLEDFVTGPIYKIVKYKNDFYSVSKINTILSLLVVLIWILLLVKFLETNNHFSWSSENNLKPDWQIITALCVTTLFILSITQGFARKRYDNEKDNYIIRNR